MSQEKPSHIYSVLISLADTTVIVPNAAVAEVMGQEVLKRSSSGPGWLFGYANWQHQDVPVISLERMQGNPMPELDRRCRVVLMNAPSQAGAFAILSRAYPMIVTLNEVALQPVAMEKGPAEELFLSKVQVANRSAVIPDLDAIASKTRAFSEA